MLLSFNLRQPGPALVIPEGAEGASTGASVVSGYRVRAAPCGARVDEPPSGLKRTSRSSPVREPEERAIFDYSKVWIARAKRCPGASSMPDERLR